VLSIGTNISYFGWPWTSKTPPRRNKIVLRSSPEKFEWR